MVKRDRSPAWAGVLVLAALLACGAAAAYGSGVAGTAAGASPASYASATGVASATVSPGVDVAVDLAVPLSDGTTETLNIMFANVTSTRTLVASKDATPAAASDGTFVFAGGSWTLDLVGTTGVNATVTVPYDPRLSDERAIGLLVKQRTNTGTGWRDIWVVGTDTGEHTISFRPDSLGQFVVAERAGVDRSTRISTATSIVAPYGTSATVVARLTGAAKEVLPGRVVTIATSRDRTTWSSPATMTAVPGRPGYYSAKVAPISGGRTLVRLTFGGEELYGASSATVTVTPKVFLTWPHVAASLTRTTTISGTVRPAHAVAVTLEMQRKSGSTWVTRRVRLKTSAAGRWATRATFTPGTWRLRAVSAADAMHAASVSQWQVLHVY